MPSACSPNVFVRVCVCACACACACACFRFDDLNCLIRQVFILSSRKLDFGGSIINI